jgi:hypothetical protein
MFQQLADLDAKEGILLMAAMAIGRGAAGASAGIFYGGWRPVAMHFGLRAPTTVLPNYVL